MTCPLTSLASNSSISTCASEGGEGEVTPRRTTVSATCLPAAATSASKSWADELEEEGAFRDEPQPARSAAPVRRLRTSQWRAVWCSERCYKDEEAPLRKVITDAVAGLGGFLVCYKKAKTFEEKVSHLPRLGYALITDGREVRPCVQALAVRPQNQPALIIVYSEQHKHADRVARWAKVLPAEGFHAPVLVVRSAREVGALLSPSPLTRIGAAGGPATHFTFNLKAITSEHATVCSTSPTSMTSTVPSLAMQRQLIGCGDATRAHCATPTAVGADATRTAALVPLAVVLVPVTPVPAEFGESPFLLEKSVEGVEPDVLCVLSSAVPSGVGPATLERMLTDSTPEVYEE